MRFKNLDLNLLAALDTLIRLRNVSRAADEMFLTQSAMSNALGRLRDYFNDPLLIQVGRGMELSPLAISLEQPLRDIIVRIEAAVLIAPTFDPLHSTRNVGMIVSDYSLQTLIPPFVRRVAAGAPGTFIDLKAQQNFPHLLLERGEADLLIAPAMLCSPNHPSESLLTDPICCVVDAAGPFARNGISRADFLTAGHVVMAPPNGGESYAYRVCREAGIDIRAEISTFAFSSIPALIEGTGRVALLQRSLAERMARLGGVVIVESPIDIPPLEQSVQWHDYRTRDPALMWLRAQLHAAVKDVASSSS